MSFLILTLFSVQQTEHLKIGLTNETKAWRMTYGKYCSNKYKTQMEDIFRFIEDLGKRLAHPVKDLDDIRFAMAALKDIRENEIRIDMSIGPIEVIILLHVLFWLFLRSYLDKFYIT